ncbi:MAG: SAM-dependent methyltransferase, partial [Myxococcota bacterium]
AAFEATVAVLEAGRVVQTGRLAELDEEPSTVALRELNRALHADDRVDVAMIPIGDGLTIARKR